MVITSKKVRILKKRTLADKVKKNFSRVKLRKSSVKVPGLKIRKINIGNQASSVKIPVSALVNILIRSALEKTKKIKENKIASEDKKYTLSKENNSVVQGGYGTVSRNYGSLIRSPYVNYGKLFSYLGNFKAKSPYDSIGSPLEMLNKSLEGSGFALIDREAMDKGAKHVRYFMSPVSDLNMASLVAPTASMSSGEWEQFKLFMQLDKVMYRLKTSTI